jgi:hypothetical protein
MAWIHDVQRAKCPPFEILRHLGSRYRTNKGEASYVNIGKKGCLWVITVKLCMAHKHTRLQTSTGQQVPLTTLGIGIFFGD